MKEHRCHASQDAEEKARREAEEKARREAEEKAPSTHPTVVALREKLKKLSKQVG